MDDTLFLKARPLSSGDGWELLSPGVGCYAQAPAAGARRGPRETAGVLVVLERSYRLLLPDGVAGYVLTPPPERKHLPVGFGTALFTLRAETAGPAPAPAAAASGLKLLLSPQAGRFWRRPEPKAPQYVNVGDELGEGKTVGLLEVMKTFNPVKYGGPERARVRGFLVDDGAEVAEGQPLIELA
ncbi:MAG: hypothetical protein EYC70_15140 [Planctomycetota bacterium]|nr:MAG: hypothetical protein EYC70_15140 [Planctomycetota bacterium]